jgi:hypothetical protein
MVVSGCDHRGYGWSARFASSKGATKPTISVDQDKTTVFWPLFIHSTADFADYLFLETEPVVADSAGGGGIMFHVSARYFQFAPSCTTTLI